MFQETSSAPITCEYALLSTKLPEGSIILNKTEESFEIGTKLKFSCSSEFSVYGEPFTVCQNNGTWSSLNFKCMLICDGPPRPVSMLISSNVESYTVGDAIKFDCIDGYSIYGNPIINCLPSGKWTKVLARCSSEFGYEKNFEFFIIF